MAQISYYELVKPECHVIKLMYVSKILHYCNKCNHICYFNMIYTYIFCALGEVLGFFQSL